MKYNVAGIELQLIEGDIAAQPDIEAVVNAANAQLKTGGGVAGAIHRAAGPKLEEACRDLAPIQVGEAVITSAFKLPNKYVVHTLGPVYGQDKPEAELLARCYKNSLHLVEECQLKSVAFPAISTGVFGYPIKEAAEISLKTVKETAEELKKIKLIRFVLYSRSDFKVYSAVAEKIFD
ncbi:O-acetyl-ADP-ribose deacetylase (regulator of RNase III), contains Macro domain [Halanaerobium congolense]|uniref:O-acetyl-ADP-ribose deacetylase (Regulator of RNase III), contains Macro domain n=1 Tax=Halanaerobium congolense TaxID=54121 RepID=A0A1I0AHE1_9FIRM|nr:macro domain-containing protein [Halanaerobium congolense]PTX17435.1 O-acetyl-ADP-ribose deacetylase (regulator of RNase III) [Halanaerobium congolense]SDF44260.1 O-acetyl-ADP-ribose deacetylase (regulator of RNase III), contains Macro domain [Halanaerobium congolense]SES93697.1 O-acetyl-ADP-ribose deacetylase (regulator of RNase III), contains Macro domain [Halanaerobium congolense]SFP25210.1 O-acetyl-ADP-ribose deacetylase (regulator of RNase III), contains Macro domain [Halanaerobium cong